MRRRVLIIEDDLDLRVVLSILLTTEGWDVAGAASLEEAEAQLCEKPDLLLLAAHVGGHEAGEILGRLACRADAPITVLVSASEEVGALAQRYGVPHARKPNDVDALMHAIDVALSQSRRPSLAQPRATWSSTPTLA